MKINIEYEFLGAEELGNIKWTEYCKTNLSGPSRLLDFLSDNEVAREYGLEDLLGQNFVYNAATQFDIAWDDWEFDDNCIVFVDFYKNRVYRVRVNSRFE